jgi:kinesin family member 1
MELKSALIVDMKDKTTIITNPDTGEKKDFTFDFSFWSHDGFDTLEDV